ncbi:M protein, partial [Streptomyces sp. SID7803]|nr:M protein [Streptomyces sp. SID7803]
EAEQKKASLVREAEKLRTDAEAEAKRVVEEGRRELEVLVRRRADINTEISRVQDVLEALESFETPPGAGGKGGAAPAANVKAGASAGTRSSGKQSDG